LTPARAIAGVGNFTLSGLGMQVGTAPERGFSLGPAVSEKSFELRPKLATNGFLSEYQAGNRYRNHH
jgi:hypothetical protein